MHAMMDIEGGSEPQDVFVELGTLIVEGRVPGGGGNGGGRGYSEGPHCSAQWHTCKPPSNFLCKRAENFRKHMLLLFQNKITMCIEVMLCADCVCGAHKAQSPEVAVVQCLCDLLLEQWTVTVINTRPGEQPPMLARGLLQAVRSQLHFSQLSAWWSSSKGVKPAHVSYRVTVPGEAFANQFQRQPDEHVFPLASVGKMSAIKVCVRSLPRMESVPAVVCPVHGGGVGAPTGAAPSPSGSTTTPLSPALGERRGERLGERLGDPSLGECLLDPPQSYRSPPRIVHPDEQGMLIRRTRVLAEGNGRWSTERPPSPRMNLQSWRRPGHLYRPNGTNDRRREGACNSKQSCSRSPDDVRGLVDDRMQTACNQPGKHHCSCEGEEDLEVPIASPTSTQVRQRRRSQVNTPPVPQPPEPANTPPLPPPHDENLSVRTGEPTNKCPRTSPPSSPNSSADEYLYLNDGSVAAPSGWLSDRRPWTSGGVDSGRSSPISSSPSAPSPPTAPDRSNAPGTTAASAAASAAASVGKTVARELDCELSPIELERVLSVLRDGKTPAIASIGLRMWRASPSKLKDTEGAANEHTPVARPVTTVYRVNAPTPSSPPDTPNPRSSAKADLFLDAILRAGRRSRSKTADAFRTKRRDAKCESKCDKIKGDSAVIEPGRVPVSSRIGKGPGEVRRLGLSHYSDLSGHKKMCHNPKAICDNDLWHCSPRGDPCLTVNTKEGREGRVEVVMSEVEEERPAKSRLKSKKGCLAVVSTPPTTEMASAVPGVPTASDRARFRQSFDSAASMVFHTRTGLPLTSSPAPVRRGTSRFDYDSSLNSVSAIRSALFESQCSVSSDDGLSISGDETESEGGARSPCSPDAGGPFPIPGPPTHSLSPCSSLLGSFEESVLNGRLEPVSTVQGFTAELGASGTFCPSHLKLPVTVFFYTLGNYDKVSTPYLGHINLGKKGYNVPRSGTIQVTLFNPMGTVIKMFVVVYDLLDMPPNSHTFLRQRTLYMPSKITDQEELRENAQKWLRYLIHLRFSSSKSGRIYLHTDIRMIIFRKSDMDTAAAHHNNNNSNNNNKNIISSSNIFDSGYEMRSFTDGPENPKFSPR